MDGQEEGDEDITGPVISHEEMIEPFHHAVLYSLLFHLSQHLHSN